MMSSFITRRPISSALSRQLSLRQFAAKPGSLSAQLLSAMALVVVFTWLLQPCALAGSPGLDRQKWLHKEASGDAYSGERVFRFQHRYAVELKNRAEFLSRIRQILEEGSILGSRPYVEYLRKYDQTTVFTTEFGASADSVACMIEVDASGERDRYVVFSISTAVKPHLRPDRDLDEERDQQLEDLVARDIELAIVQAQTP